MTRRTPAPPPDVHETSRPRWRFVLLAVVLMALAGEILASWFFARYGQRLAFPDPRRFTATPEEAARVQGLFDADLGWRPRYACSSRSARCETVISALRQAESVLGHRGRQHWLAPNARLSIMARAEKELTERPVAWP